MLVYVLMYLFYSIFLVFRLHPRKSGLGYLLPMSLASCECVSLCGLDTLWIAKQ